MNNFSTALDCVKGGQKISRDGWNGRGMYVVLMQGYPKGVTANKETQAVHNLKEGEKIEIQPYLVIRNVNGSVSNWVPSINDLLAEDWIVELAPPKN
jgi:hypothetical protein